MPTDTLEKYVKKTIQFTPQAYEELERLKTITGADNYQQVMVYCMYVGRDVINREQEEYELTFVPTLKKRWGAFKEGLDRLCDVFTFKVKVKQPTTEIMPYYKSRDSRSLKEMTVQFTPQDYKELERLRSVTGADNYSQLMQHLFTIGSMVIDNQNEGFKSALIPRENSGLPDLQHAIVHYHEIIRDIKTRYSVPK